MQATSEERNAGSEVVGRDAHEQLRALYMSLLAEQARFDEFKQLLGTYPAEACAREGDETPEAVEVRRRLNARIQDWIGGDFEGLSATQLLLWRTIVVEERFNVALSPWKESNWY